LAAACTGENKEGGGEGEEEKEGTKADASSLAKDLEETLVVSPESTAAKAPIEIEPSRQPTQSQSPTPLFVLYGSATGNAEHMAKDLAASYQTALQSSPTAYFPSVTCCPLNDYKKKCLDVWSAPPASPAAKHGVLFLCSTTGNADAPENADRFVRWLKRKSTEPTRPFRHCAYAVLGLGDSNYDVFCAVGKLIDRKVGELGGTRARSVACADEATGLEEVVEPWVTGVLDDLARVCGGLGATDSASTTSASASAAAEEDSSAAEEKKMDDEPRPISTQTPIPTTPSSEGVATLRKHLGLAPQDPLPAVPHSCLPAMTSHLSSCEFVRDDDDDDDIANGATRSDRPRENSVEDHLTETSGSSGCHFTLTRPYESRILNARYLTKGTGAECARNVCEMMMMSTTTTEKTKHWNDAACSDEEEEATAERDRLLLRAMEMYDRHFPLAAPSNNDADGSNDNDERQQRLQYVKNGKRVIEMTLALPDDFTLEYEPGDSVGLLVPNAPHATRFVLDMLRAHHGILPTQKIVLDGTTTTTTTTDSRSRPITVGEAVRNKMDLCSPVKKKRLFLLSQYATDPEERRALRLLSANVNANGNGSGVEETSGRSVGDLFQTYVEEQHRSIVDILKEFPSCQSIPLEGLFGILPAIPPRYYSVCSSPLSGKEVIDGYSFHLKVAFSVVDYLTPSSPNDPNSHRRMGGVATRYLECLCSPFLCNDSAAATTTAIIPPTIQIFPKPTHDFRLPTDLSTPLVLIGPGTGIAPFLGFLSHRRAQISSLESKQAAEVASEGTWRGGYELDPEELNISNSEARGLNLAVDYMRKQRHGEIDLFFGCRYRDHDWLYEKEVEEFRTMGIVSRSYNAFSREEGQEKMYVQTIMLKDEACGSRLVDMITKQMASVYICGDGNAMGRDVQEAITRLLAEKKFGKQSDEREATEKAVEYVDQMKRSGRFVLDIWS